MPEGEEAERTESPTARRRQEARQAGQVAKSMDLTGAFVLLGGLIVLSVEGPRFVTGFREMIVRGLEFDSRDVLAMRTAQEFWHLLVRAGGVVLPFLLALTAIGIAANFLQVGFLLTGKPLSPSFHKLNPLAGLRRLISKRTAVKLVTDLLKVGLVGYVAYAAIRDKLGAMVGVAALGHAEIFRVSCDMIMSLGIRLGIVLLVLALIDYAWQRWQHEQELKMTKQEVREELRRMEGDPHIKNRRRQIAMQMAMQRTRKEVPTADVVVTNPTEFAVAIKYAPDEMAAPRVVAKGADFMALQIRKLAQAHGVPIVQRKPLARALYASVEVGQEIPPKFYKAIAEILAYVYEVSGKSKRMAEAIV